MIYIKLLLNKMKRILKFEQFDKTNEELLPQIFTKLKNWIMGKMSALKGWAKTFYAGLADGSIRIGKGGKPVAMLYDAANGSVLSQLRQTAGVVSESNINEEARVPLEYRSEDASVRDVPAEELIELIEDLYYERTHGGPAKPLFIFGAPGIGKTEIVAQAADVLGISLLNLDAQNMAMEDFMGVPTTITVEEPEFEEGVEGRRIRSVGKGKTRFNPPAVLPTDNGSNGKGGILFLDELNKADDYLLRKLNQFVQKGRLNDYVLPSNWIIVAAGNRPQDRVDITAMDTSFVQRFRIVNYVPEIGVDPKGNIVSGWAKYAEKTGQVLPELIYYLAADTEQFHYLDTEKEIGIYPTPRSWTDGARSLFSEMERRGYKSWREIPSRKLQSIFHDAVGTAAAAKFVEYLDILRELTDEDMNIVLTDSDRAKKVAKFEKNKRYIYAISHSLLKKAEKDTDVAERDEKVYHVINYIARYGQFEILTWLISMIRSKFPEWKTFDTTNAKTPGYQWRDKGMKIVSDSRKKSGI